jgi:hypothetical protein
MWSAARRGNVAAIRGSQRKSEGARQGHGRAHSRRARASADAAGEPVPSSAHVLLA